MTGQQAGCGQQSAITAYDDGQVTMPPQFAQSKGFSRSINKVGTVLFHHNLQPARQQMPVKLGQCLADLFGVGFADQGNSLKTGVHGLCLVKAALFVFLALF